MMHAASPSSPSLRKQLLLTISVCLLLVWGSVAWFAYDKGLHEAQELMDGQLALSARLLDGQINHEENHHSGAWYSGLDVSPDSTNPALIENLDPAGRLPYEQELAFQICTVNGDLKLRSVNAKSMQPILEAGYHHQEFNGILWRTYVKKARDEHYLIQVAHPVATRNQIGLDVAWRATLPLFFALPLLILMMGWAINRSLSPLNKIAVNLSQRTTDELDPVLLVGVPKEIFPIIRAFNALLERVSFNIKNERRFTSNAAHELRTPLAGIKLYAQLANTATDAVEREKFLAQVLNGIARSDRLVDQMLRLARLDPENSSLKREMEDIDIENLLLEVQDMEMVNVKVKHQTIELDIPLNARSIKGYEDLLLVALCNLVGNASRYSPSNTPITIGSWFAEGAYGLYVEDQGPGIDSDDLPTITQRFKRGKDVTAEGSGLGLAIVERIGAIHQASLSLSNLPRKGLRAELIWKK